MTKGYRKMNFSHFNGKTTIMNNKFNMGGMDKYKKYLHYQVHIFTHLNNFKVKKLRNILSISHCKQKLWPKTMVTQEPAYIYRFNLICQVLLAGPGMLLLLYL
jgi:hypothetical protein